VSRVGLNQIDTVIFDKTGTLTEGRLTLRSLRPLGHATADTCLAWAAAQVQLRALAGSVDDTVFEAFDAMLE